MAFETPASHHRMICDTVRVMAYRAAIFAAARDKVVVDLGCGSGILSIFAVQAGARRVFAVEETKVAGLAALMFKANGCDDRVTLFRGNSRDLELPERADLIVHEILGADPFDEGVLPSIEDARARFLAPGGRLLPDAFEVGCVGLEVGRAPSHSERMVREAQEAARLYGINVDPYLLALEAYRDAVSLNLPADPKMAELILTETALLRRVDLHGALDTAEQAATLTVADDGMLDTLLVFFRAQLGDVGIGNSPFGPLTSWGWALRDLRRRRLVRAGDRLQVRSRVEPIDGRQRLLVEVD
jgi:predicted RNA methylase